jgi:hypothetical protein
MSLLCRLENAIEENALPHRSDANALFSCEEHKNVVGWVRLAIRKEIELISAAKIRRYERKISYKIERWSE